MKTQLFGRTSLLSIAACFALCAPAAMAEPESSKNQASDSAVSHFEAGMADIYDNIPINRLQGAMLYGVDTLTEDEIRAYERGMAHLKTAAEGDVADAQFQYALLLLDRSPRPTPTNETVVTPSGPKFDAPKPNLELHKEREHWLRRAAQQDHPLANYQLGVQAVDPFGPLGATVRDAEKLPFLKRAAELGVKEAQELLDRLQK